MRLLIDVNQTERIENVTLEICNEFGLVSDVCSGAVYEYKVKDLCYFHLHIIFLLANRMSLSKSFL
jgi:hypothetical protein